MKKALSSIMMAICIALVSVVIAFAFNVGDKVSVQWKGQWYPATVLKVDNNKCFIHYDGYASSWDEWVGPARIKGIAAPAFNVGDSVQVKWKGSWYPAKILKEQNGQFFIHYDGYGSNWDEWVGLGRIKK